MILAIKNIYGKFSVLHSKSINVKIFTSATIITFFTLIVKILSMGKELIIAYQFGIGDEVDAFNIAFLMPQFAVNVLTGAIAASLVPIAIQSIKQKGKEKSQSIIGESLFLMCGVVLLVALLFWLIAPYILPIISSGFSSDKYELTLSLYYLLIPIIIFNGLSFYFAAVMNADHNFSIPAALPIVNALCIVLVLLVAEQSIYYLVWGSLLGSVVELLLFLFFTQKIGWVVLPKWYGFLFETREIVKQYLPLLAGAALMSGTVVIDQSMAAMLEPGSVSALNYGNKITAVVLSLAAAGLSVAVLPYFSEQIANKDWFGVHNTLFKFSYFLMVMTIPLTLILIFSSDLLIQLLFERGAFDEDTTGLVSVIQQLYFIQIPFYLIGVFWVKVLSATQKSHWLLYISIANLSINIIGNYVFLQWFGVAGIALSTSIVYILSAASICFLVYRHIQKMLRLNS